MIFLYKSDSLFPNIEWTLIQKFEQAATDWKMIDILGVLGSCDCASWKVGWREINKQHATNLMFIIKLLSQHVSGIIMPIIR